MARKKKKKRGKILLKKAIKTLSRRLRRIKDKPFEKKVLQVRYRSKIRPSCILFEDLSYKDDEDPFYSGKISLNENNDKFINSIGLVWDVDSGYLIEIQGGSKWPCLNEPEIIRFEASVYYHYFIKNKNSSESLTLEGNTETDEDPIHRK